ncbi:hypothetical protein AAG906_020839 [Vitis piasezkii]
MEEADSGMIKLTVSNYSIWNTRMEDILYCKELFERIECKAKEVDAYSLWHKLKSLYERKTAHNKTFTIRRLGNLKYKDGNSVDSTWVVDTTTSFHITTQRFLLFLLQWQDVELETNIGCKLVLKNVRHVPKMRFSLIFVGKLDDEGYHSHLGEADNGGKYRGPFEQYYISHDISLEKTVPKTPQQNGVAKRMNRTIYERIRCMLSHARLPKSFWGEAMRTTIDLINMSPSYPLKGDIPERHLGVFGCRAFVHVPRDERSKLDSKTKQCIFLGLAASMNLEIEQLDVKIVFLHGDLEEEIYMEQPEGFTMKGKEHLVCRLKKNLYGLK